MTFPVINGLLDFKNLPHGLTSKEPSCSPWIYGTINEFFTLLVRKLGRIPSALIHAISNWHSTQYHSWTIHQWKNCFHWCRQKRVSPDEVLLAQKTPFRISLQNDKYIFYKLNGFNEPSLKHVFIASLPSELQLDLQKKLTVTNLDIADISLGKIFQMAMLCLDKICE